VLVLAALGFAGRACWLAGCCWPCW